MEPRAWRPLIATVGGGEEAGGGGGGSPVVTAIAIDRDKNSQSAVKWAVENLIKKTASQCILLHVRTHGDYSGKLLLLPCFLQIR